MALCLAGPCRVQMPEAQRNWDDAQSRSCSVDWSKRAARLVSPPWSLWEWVLFVGAHGETVIFEEF